MDSGVEMIVNLVKSVIQKAESGFRFNVKQNLKWMDNLDKNVNNRTSIFAFYFVNPEKFKNLKNLKSTYCVGSFGLNLSTDLIPESSGNDYECSGLC